MCKLPYMERRNMLDSFEFGRKKIIKSRKRNYRMIRR